MSEEHILVQILRALERINESLVRVERLLNDHFNRITGGTIHRIGNSMGTPALPPLGPGVAAKFQVAWQAGAVPDTNTVAANTAWSSSDPTNVPVVMDPADPTGATADVTLASGEDVTENVTLTVVYTNPDGTTATAEATFDFVNGTVGQADVTAGTISRIA